MGLGPGRGGQALGCLLPCLLSLQVQGHSGDRGPSAGSGVKVRAAFVPRECPRPCPG